MFLWKGIVAEYIINELLSEPDNHIRDKVKVVLDLSNYTTTKELEHPNGIDTSDLVTKKGFIALKADVDKLDINKLTNVPTSLRVI